MLIGKSEPDKNSTIITVTKKCTPQPIPGAQKGTALTIKRSVKKINMATAIETTKAIKLKGLVWKKNGGLRIRYSKENSTAANNKLRDLLEMSLVNQYLK